MSRELVVGVEKKTTPLGTFVGEENGSEDQGRRLSESTWHALKVTVC